MGLESDVAIDWKTDFIIGNNYRCWMWLKNAKVELIAVTNFWVYTLAQYVTREQSWDAVTKAEILTLHAARLHLHYLILRVDDSTTSNWVNFLFKIVRIWQNEAKVAKIKSPSYDFKIFSIFEIYSSSPFQKYLLSFWSPISYFMVK